MDCKMCSFKMAPTSFSSGLMPGGSLADEADAMQVLSTTLHTCKAFCAVEAAFLFDHLHRRGHKVALHGQNSSWNTLHSENEQTSYRKIAKSEMFLARTACTNFVGKRLLGLTAVVYHITSRACQLIVEKCLLGHFSKYFYTARGLHHCIHISWSLYSLQSLFRVINDANSTLLLRG